MRMDFFPERAQEKRVNSAKFERSHEILVNLCAVTVFVSSFVRVGPQAMASELELEPDVNASLF